MAFCRDYGPGQGDLRQIFRQSRVQQCRDFVSGRCAMRFLKKMSAGLLIGLACTAASAVDLDKGKEINGTCAACHGEFGQGGKKGEYPRLAGQRAKYIELQLRSFRSRTRVNIPMFPYTQERELPDDDIRDIAAYLAGIELPTQMPDFAGHED